jgi:hypothetical protein
MVTFLFTSIVLLAFLILALYLWQKPSAQPKIEGLENSRDYLPRAESSRLFIDPPDDERPNQVNSDQSARREQLLNRATAGDHSAVDEAYKNFDRPVYGEILTALVNHIDSDAKLLSVLSHVTRNELPVNKELAQATIKSWESSLDRGSTSRTLHITALADDAQLYQSTVESALEFWRRGLLTGVSAVELRALFDGEFWVLSTETRNSGAGFLLKRTLAKARRELTREPHVNNESISPNL